MAARVASLLLGVLLSTLPTAGTGRDADHVRHVEQARMLRQAFLERGFIADIPPSDGGRATGVAGERRSRFDLSGAPRISGALSIQRLQGRIRISLARTHDTLQFSRIARVSGTASVARGQLRIYSRVSVDTWHMARALVDTPSRQPPPEDFRLEGWTVTEVPAGEPVRFDAQLLALGGDYLLVLEAPGAAAEGIELHFDRD